KHMRRAVKAAFALALAVPIVLGGTANASPTATTITVGTKNFTEAYVLGQLYKQALEAKGFKVAYKENIGSSELIDTALTSAKINVYPEYTGVLALNIAHAKSPKTAAATYAAAKAFEEKRGFTLLKQTPFYDGEEVRPEDHLRPEEGPQPVVRRLSRVRQADHLFARDEADLRAEEDQVRAARHDPGHEADRLGEGHRWGHLHDRAGLGDGEVRRARRHEAHLRLPERGSGRVEEARFRVRLQVHLGGERRQRQADEPRDACHEQGGRGRQEDACGRREGVPEGQRPR